MFKVNNQTIALLGEDSKKVNNILEIILDKELKKTDFTEDNVPELIYNFSVKPKNFTIQKIDLKGEISESVKVYFNSEILIVYFLLDENKKIESQIKDHIFMANVFGVNNVIVILDSINISDTRTFIKIREKITDSFKKRNFKITQINFIEYRGNKESLKGCIYENLLIGSKLGKVKDNNKNAKLILSIDNVFKVDKNHIGVNGKINSGELTVNSKINILPLKESYKVLEIQSRHKTINKAEKGEQIGFLLKNGSTTIEKGMIVTDDKTSFKPVSNITSQIISLSDKQIKLNESYIFVSHNIESIITINSIVNKDKDNNKTFHKELLTAEKATVNLSLRKNIIVTSHIVNKKLGSFAILDKERRCLLGLGIIKTLRS